MHEVRVVGMDIITEMEETRNVKKLVNLFTGAVNKSKLAFTRPHGAFNVLIKMVSKSLHYKYCLEAGEMRLNKSVSSPGWAPW